jgi:hypothetical protein
MDPVVVQAVGNRTWDWPCLHIESSDTVTLQLGWLNDDGSEFTLPGQESGDAVTVTLSYMSAEGTRGTTATSVDAVIESNRVVVTEFDASILRGVYAGVVRFADDLDVVRLSLRFILSVTPDRFASDRPAVTLQDVHMALFDRLGSENLVEGTREFSDRLLFDGLCAAVRQWNESGVATRRYSTQSFPSPQMLTVGAAAWSLLYYRTLLARNAVAAQGQVSIEADRFKAYAALGDALMRQYSVWLAETAKSDDANSSFLLV